MMLHEWQRGVHGRGNGKQVLTFEQPRQLPISTAGHTARGCRGCCGGCSSKHAASSLAYVVLGPCSLQCVCRAVLLCCCVLQEGQPLVLSAVRQAEQRLVADGSRNKEYQPM